MQHLNIFGPIALSSSSVIGTKIRLDRPTDREHGCCDNVAIIGKAMSMTCTTCGRFRGWFSAEAATFIIETRARFGAREHRFENPLACRRRRWRALRDPNAPAGC